MEDKKRVIIQLQNCLMESRMSVSTKQLQLSSARHNLIKMPRENRAMYVPMPSIVYHFGMQVASHVFSYSKELDYVSNALVMQIKGVCTHQLLVTLLLVS